MLRSSFLRRDKMQVRKTLKDFEDNGFRTDFVKIGDQIDSGIMKVITGVNPDNAEGMSVIQSKITNDILGKMKLYETVYKREKGPYIYRGLCEKGRTLNRHPDSALPVFVCSPYREHDNLTTEFCEQLAIVAARQIFEEGNLPVVPHLYFPRFLTDDGYERDYGIAAGHHVMRFCEKIEVYVIDDYISAGMASDIEYATEQLALQPVYHSFTYDSAHKFVEEMLNNWKSDNMQIMKKEVK